MINVKKEIFETIKCNFCCSMITLHNVSNVEIKRRVGEDNTGFSNGKIEE